MFSTLGEIKEHRFSLASSLFNIAAVFKSHALPVAFSAARLLNGMYQTGKYVLMYEA